MTSINAWRAGALLLTANLYFQSIAAADDALDDLFASPEASESQNSDAAAGEGEPAATQPAATPAPVRLAEEPPESGRSVPRSRQLEEIIVTAQKREQGLSDVPISMSALTGEKLDDAGIENLMDLSEYAPNFKMVDGGLMPLIYMRGVGSGSNQGFEMSVGMYNDGIHYGRPFQALSAFLDVERVEVLKGPQSILFGKNAIAGALNITSGKPRDEFAAQISTSWFEPTSDGELSGFVTGPVMDDLDARLAFRYRTEGGYVYNISQQRDELQLQEYGLRGTVAYDATDNLSFTLKLETTDRQQDGRTYQIVDRGILNLSNDSYVGFDDVRDTNLRESGAIDSDNVELMTSWLLGEHELDFVTGFSQYTFNDLFDADVSTIDSGFVDGLEDYQQFSQEIRWTSPPSDSLNFIAGVFYQGSEQTYKEVVALRLRSGTVALVAAPGESIDLLALAGPANLVEVASGDVDRLFETDNQAYSAFTQMIWDFSPSWSLTAGLRFVTEKKTGLRDLNVYQTGTQDPVDPVTAQAFAQLKIKAHMLSGERRSNSLLPSLVLQNHLTDDIMLYGSWARGAKSGGYDARNNNDDPGPTGGLDNFEYEDEVADAFELGGKLSLFERAAELNFALYMVNYDEMQVSVFDGVAGFAVTNAGQARVQGIETDGRWLVSDELMLSASLAYLDFSWVSYPDGPCYFGKEPDSGDFCNFKGKPNQQTPKWSGSLSAEYSSDFGSRFNWSAATDVNFRTRHFTSGDLDPRGEQEGYYKINMRLAVSAYDNRWSMALVGKNLTDEITGGIGAPIPLDTGGFMLTSERTRQYGLELRYRFGS